MSRSGLALAGQTSPPSQHPRSIDACSECCATLGLLAPDFLLPAHTWLCGRCGSAYFAASVNCHSQSSRGLARKVNYHDVLNAASVVKSSRRNYMPRRDLQQVLTFLAGNEHGGSEKRDEPRYAAAMPVLAMPLGPNFRVIGPSVQLTTLNISKSGASFIDVQSSNAAFLAIDFSYVGFGSIQAILKVQRVHPFLSAYEIAGRWQCRINPIYQSVDPS